MFSIQQNPPHRKGWSGVLPALFIRRDELKQVTYFTFKNGTYPCQNVSVQPCYVIVAVVVYLRPLHFRTMAQFIFTQSGLLEKFIQLNYYFPILLFHANTPVCVALCRYCTNDIC